MNTGAYIHTGIHTVRHTHIHAVSQPYRQSGRRTYIQACMHIYTHTYRGRGSDRDIYRGSGIYIHIHIHHTCIQAGRITDSHTYIQRGIHTHT